MKEKILKGRNLKRLLSAFLTLVMVFGMIPNMSMTTFAAAEPTLAASITAQCAPQTTSGFTIEPMDFYDGCWFFGAGTTCRIKSSEDTSKKIGKVVFNVDHCDSRLSDPGPEDFKMYTTGNVTYDATTKTLTVDGCDGSVVWVQLNRTYVYIKSVDIYWAPHTCNLTEQNGQAATCTEDGWNDYYQCTDTNCGKIFEEDNTSGTAYDSLDAWKASDAGKNGKTKLGHDWQYEEDETKLVATCRRDESHTVSLTLNARDEVYSGSAVNVEFDEDEVKTWNEATEIEQPTFTYYKKVVADGVTSEVKTNSENSGASVEGGAPVNAGTYVLKAQIDDAVASKEFSITKKNIADEDVVVTLSGAGLTGDGTAEHPYKYTYDGTVRKPEVKAEYLQHEVLTYGTDNDYTITGRTSFRDVSANNTIIVTGNGNYTGSTTLTWSIDATALNVSLSVEGWTYGDEPNAPQVTGNTANGTETFTYFMLEGQNEYVKTTAANSGAASEGGVPVYPGNYRVYVEVESKDNYAKGDAFADFTIEKKTIKVTPESATKIYGERDPKFTYTVEGLVGEDKLAGKLDRVESANQNVGTYPIIKGSLSEEYNPNYIINVEEGATLEITKKELTDDMFVLYPNYFLYKAGTQYEPEFSVKDNTAKLGNIKASDYEVFGDGHASEIGSYELKIEATENGNYKGTLTKSWYVADLAEPDTYDYDGQPHTVIYEESEYLRFAKDADKANVNYEDLDFSLSKAPEFTEAGTHYVHFCLTLDDAEPVYGTVKVVIDPVEITFTVPESMRKKVKGEEDPEFKLTKDDIIAGTFFEGDSFDSLNIQLTRVAGENVGSYSFIATVGENGNKNYKPVMQSGCSFRITRESIDIPDYTVVINEADKGSAKELNLRSVLERFASANLIPADIVDSRFSVDILSGNTSVLVGRPSIYDDNLTYTLSEDIKSGSRVVISIIVKNPVEDDSEFNVILETIEQTAEADLVSTAGSTTDVTLPVLPVGATYGEIVNNNNSISTANVSENGNEVTVTSNGIDSTEAITFTVKVNGGPNFSNYDVTVTINPIPHNHSWGFVSDGNKIKTECNGLGMCDVEAPAYIEIDADDDYYTGEGIGAVVSDWSNTNVSNLPDKPTTITYTGVGNNYSGTTAPKNAGTYEASITIGTATASVEYEIKKAPIEKIEFVEPAAPATGNTPATTVSEADTRYEATIAWDTTATTFAQRTAYTATVTITANPNYEFTASPSVPDGWVVDSNDGSTVTLIKEYEETLHVCTLSSVIAGQDPTCEAEGWRSYYQCTDELCGKIYGTSDTNKTAYDNLEDWKNSSKGKISELGHTGGTATCQAKAVCTRCSEPYGEVGTHYYENEYTTDTEATCLADGWESRHCIWCAATTDGREINSLGGHTGGEATCQSGKICTRCQTVYTEKGDHNFATIYTVDVDATCEEKGAASMHCLTEGCTETKAPIEIKAKGHIYEETYTVDVEPTCGVKGSESRHCTRLNCSSKTDERDIDPLEHEGGVATCQSKAVCELCKEEYGELGEHVFAKTYTVDEKATCTKAGSESKHCTIAGCDETEGSREIKPLGHTGGKATCQSKAVCTRCKEEYGNLAGHVYDATFTVDKAATCTDKGSKSKHCATEGCTEKASVTEIPALGHTGGKATCQAKAVCTRCKTPYGELGKHDFAADSKTCRTNGCTAVNPNYVAPAAPKVSVSYQTHIQTYGDSQGFKKDGEIAGTSGESKRLEAIKVKVSGNANLGIAYTTHVETYGWLPWSHNGETSGTSGEAKRMEALKIQLKGADASKYDVYYRVHAQSYGWLAWAKNGEAAGTAGLAKRLEGIQIVVVEKGKTFNQNMGNIKSANAKAFIQGTSTTPNPVKYDEPTPNVMYKTHVQTYGWQNWKTNGDVSGTIGQAKRLEAINIKLTNTPYAGGIQYKTHVQSLGWEKSWRANGAMSGTSGIAKRLEAIQIELTGEMAKHYDVYYRVHAQSYGWLGWAKNGASAGTEGYAKRLEGIQIVLVKKGDKAPAANYGGVTSKTAKPYMKK